MDNVARSEDVRKLARLIGGKKKLIRVGGLFGSSAPLVFAALQKGGLPSVLFILDDEESAGYFYNDLRNLIASGDSTDNNNPASCILHPASTDNNNPASCILHPASTDNLFFFPSSYRRAIKYNQKDDANVILRTEVLTRLRTDSSLLIVTYPEALAEMVVSEKMLADDTIGISVGGTYDVTELEQRLFDLGFNRTDYVYEPGQFAIRGSIVDIYSFSKEIPVRIDFMGDEVDSIRTFDIQSQLSQERLKGVDIVPEVSAKRGDMVPFLSFVSDEAIVVASNFDFVADRIDIIHREGISRQAVIAETTKDAKGGDFAMLSTRSDFEKGMEGKRMVALNSGENADVAFDISPQPLFHKNFELLSEELLRLKSEGYSINISSDSDKQIKRLKDIFDSLADGVEWKQIAFNAVKGAIHEGFIDNHSKQCYFTDHQIFDRFHKYSLKSDKAHRGKVALTLKEIQQFEIGDYVVHIDHGVGKFGGLVRVPQNGQMQEMIKLVYQNDDVVYVSIHALHKVSKYKGREGEQPRLNRIGTGAWERMKDRVKTKVKDIARDLIRLYAQRRQEKGFAYSPDSYMQHELEASFIYEDTPDQNKATQDVKADMEKSVPMDRLVCGDVGFGKTEVAVRAAFKAATDGKQVAVMVPTTILAYQHYQTFSERLKDFPVTVEYLTRARTAKQISDILDRLKQGKIDIIIGTHKLIGKTVGFKDLGLLIIDEEQKFGVAVKERLRQLKVNVDTLTMTATPIPRTLQFSLMGARDLSIIQTPPPNRYPIQTEIHTFSPEIVCEAINFEMSRNGQVFFVNNRINDLYSIKEMIQERIPDVRICIGHGRMNPQELEQIVFDFMNYDYDVMLSTTIVENGVDIPNANTIIINAAQNYGLSDLHQMRGRVGRSNKKAFCYLLAPPLASLNEQSRRRLQALENFSDLGSGIHIAMQDLDIRGAGNMLGAEQSGFIADLGYETYQKVLNEAVAELKETEFPDLLGTFDNPEDTEINDENGDHLQQTMYVAECVVESELIAYFPEEFVPSSGERMSLYRELDSITSRQQLEAYRTRLVDRFGQIPDVAEELIRIMPLKWQCQRLGIEKVMLKGGNMILVMVSNFDSPYYKSDTFYKLINYATSHPRTTRLRDGEKRSLIVNDIKSITKALEVVDEIQSK